MTRNKYKYGGNLGEIVYFNNFLGQIEDMENSPDETKKMIEREYEKCGIKGKCENYFTVKRVKLVRQVNRFALVATRQ